jgi:hypothetical protein
MAGRTLTANNEGQVTRYEKVEKLEGTLPPAWFLSIAEAARAATDAKQVERGTTHHAAARQTMNERAAAESPSATITGRTSSDAATRLFQLTREFLPVRIYYLSSLNLYQLFTRPGACGRCGTCGLFPPPKSEEESGKA